MASRVVGVVLVAGAAALLSGCGTVFNFRGPDDPSNKDWDDIVPRKSVYGGTRTCAVQAWATTIAPFTELDPMMAVACGLGSFFPYTFLILADTPLCIVADTLTLPWTIGAETSGRTDAPPVGAARPSLKAPDPPPTTRPVGSKAGAE